MWMTVLDWHGDSADLKLNENLWSCLVSCRKKTQQVRAGTNCGHYCSLAWVASHHQGRTPGSTSGSNSRWQAIIAAKGYPTRFYTDFHWILRCCHSYKLLQTLPTSLLWYSQCCYKYLPQVFKYFTKYCSQTQYKWRCVIKFSRLKVW